MRKRLTAVLCLPVSFHLRNKKGCRLVVVLSQRLLNGKVPPLAVYFLRLLINQVGIFPHKLRGNVDEILGSSKVKQGGPSLVFLVTKKPVHFVRVFFQNNLREITYLQ